MKQNLNNLKSDENNEFYRELDEKTAHKSCCSCQTLALLFAFLAVILFGAIFYLYWQITHGDVNLPLTSKVASTQDFKGKLQNPQVEGNEATLVLNAADLNAALNNSFSINRFVLKDVNLSINPKEFLIYGNLIKPISSKIVLTCVPSVQNGKIKMDVTGSSAGKVNLPKYLNQKIAANLNSILDDKMSKFYEKYTVTEVNLDQNKMTIIGIIK